MERVLGLSGWSDRALVTGSFCTYIVYTYIYVRVTRSSLSGRIGKVRGVDRLSLSLDIMDYLIIPSFGGGGGREGEEKERDITVDRTANANRYLFYLLTVSRPFLLLLFLLFFRRRMNYSRDELFMRKKYLVFLIHIPLNVYMSLRLLLYYLRFASSGRRSWGLFRRDRRKDNSLMTNLGPVGTGNSLLQFKFSFFFFRVPVNTLVINVSYICVCISILSLSPAMI